MTFETLIGLMAVTGLRIGEALRLDRDNVNLTEGVLEVRHTKFGKSRQVPLHTTTIEALPGYARRRDHRYRGRLVTETSGDLGERAPAFDEHGGM